jgi:hypothetical protein
VVFSHITVVQSFVYKGEHDSVKRHSQNVVLCFEGNCNSKTLKRLTSLLYSQSIPATHLHALAMFGVKVTFTKVVCRLSDDN